MLQDPVRAWEGTSIIYHLKHILSEPVQPLIRKRLSLAVLMLVLFSLPLFSDSYQEEQSAVIQGDAPAIRYWKPALTDSLAVQTVSSLDSGSSVPLRSDPKLLVLLYHNVVYGRTGNVYNRDIYNFEHDLSYIKRNFIITNFSDLPSYNGHPMRDRAIITFDDGDLSIYAIVYPLFKKYNIQATFFLVPNFIGQVGYMSWDQVREMNNYRNERNEKLFYFGSHSLTHRRLGELSDLEVVKELNESKRIIEKEIGEEVNALALPFGSGAGDENIISSAKAAGYDYIRTSTKKAMLLSDMDAWNVGAMNVENYSTDVMVQNALQVVGR